MKYPLESPHKSKEANLLLWIQRFLKLKLTTLSKRLVRQKENLLLLLEPLRKEAPSLEYLQEQIRVLRNEGIVGINTYASPLFKFFVFFSQQKHLHSLQEIDEELVSEFLNQQGCHLSNLTLRNYRVVLVGFFHYIDKQNQAQNKSTHLFDMALQIHAICNTKRLPSYLNEEELHHFLNALNHYAHSTRIAHIRDSLLLKMITYTGMRIGEVLLLQEQDIILEGGFYLIHLQGKGNKDRRVMIKRSDIQEQLQAWLQAKRGFPAPSPLFCNKRGQALTQPYVYTTLKNILQQMGVKKLKMGTHLLRHSFATLLYQKYRDILLVQEVLGHADLNTSKIYTHLNQEQLMLAANIL